MSWFDDLKEFIAPVANAARDEYIRDNFPEKTIPVDNTSDHQVGFTPAELAEELEENRNRLYLVGGAAGLTGLLIYLIAARS